MRNRLPRFASVALLIGLSAALPALEPEPLQPRHRSLWLPGGLGSVLIHAHDAVHPSLTLELPHALADTREAVLGGSGGGVVGDGATGASLGLGVPLRQLVLGTSLGYLGDADGSLGRAVVTLARPLGARMAGGVSGRLGWASGDGDADLGAAFDLGLRYRVGGIGDLSRVELHAVLQGAGYEARRAGREPLSGAFSPSIGARARLYDSTGLELDGSLEFRLDTASGLWIAAAGALRFAGGLEATLAADLPLQRNSGRLWPGVSLGVSLPLGAAEPAATGLRLAIRPELSGDLLLGGSFRTRFPSSDLEPPDLALEILQPGRGVSLEYPGTGAGADTGAGPRVGLSAAAERRQLVLVVSGRDQRAIANVGARIVAPDGSLVREWQVRQVGSTLVGGSISQRLTSDLAPLQLEGTLAVPIEEFPTDGRYVLILSAEDRAGNRTISSDIPVYVDREAPRVSLQRVEPQPEGDGQTRMGPERPLEMLLELDGADVLEVSVVNEAGSELRRLDAVPEAGDRLRIRWDGVGTDGVPVADGVYRIVARAADELGNRSEFRSSELLFRSIRPELRLAVDRTLVNAEMDNRGEAVAVRASLEPLPGLQDWRIDLVPLDAQGSVGSPLRSWSGIDLPPERLELAGSDFPVDGRYRLTGSSRYEGGASATDASRIITVDREGPEVRAGLDRTRIGPEDARNVSIFLETREVADGRLLLAGADGAFEPVLAFEGAPERLDWNLVGPDQRFLEPGEYRLALSVRDPAGNRTRSDELRIELVPRLAGAEITALGASISPDGNGRADELAFALRGPGDALSGRFSVTITGSGATRRLSGELPVPDRIVWDGRDDEGLPFPDGVVTAELRVEAPGRGSVVARSEQLTVDTSPPELEFAAAGPLVISPDDDGVQDALLLRISVGDAAFVALDVSAVDAEVGSEASTLVLPVDELQGESLAPVRVVPRRQDGTLLADGRYTVSLRARDASGNSTVSQPLSFEIDTRPVSGFLRLSAGAVSPNGDGIRDQLTVRPVIPDTDGLEAWSIEAVGPQGGRSVLVSGTGPDIPAAIEWPRMRVPDGSYHLELTGAYRHGPVVSAVSPRVRVDTQAPELELALRPQPFSPDGDGRDDVVRFAVEVADDSPIAFWLLEISDSRGAFFYDLGGEGAPPEELVWDGRARNGETVLSAEVYPYHFEIVDSLGNRQEREGELLVDVLVEAIEGGYRIRVPRITFPGNSSLLILDEQDPRGAQNRAVIDRVVEILGRFPEYEIVVEGHAVNLSGTEAEEERELEPLSRARAESVRDALIDRGVAAGLLSARGRGGTMPLVPHSDEENRWKNRRVDFILQR